MNERDKQGVTTILQTCLLQACKVYTSPYFSILLQHYHQIHQPFKILDFKNHFALQKLFYFLVHHVISVYSQIFSFLLHWSKWRINVQLVVYYLWINSSHIHMWPYGAIFILLQLIFKSNSVICNFWIINRVKKDTMNFFFFRFFFLSTVVPLGAINL